MVVEPDRWRSPNQSAFNGKEAIADLRSPPRCGGSRREKVDFGDLKRCRDVTGRDDGGRSSFFEAAISPSSVADVPDWTSTVSRTGSPRLFVSSRRRAANLYMRLPPADGSDRAKGQLVVVWFGAREVVESRAEGDLRQDDGGRPRANVRRMAAERSCVASLYCCRTVRASELRNGWLTTDEGVGSGGCPGDAPVRRSGRTCE